MSDGSIVLVGSTMGDWGTENEGDEDFVGVKLDADGTLLWIWQVCLERDAKKINELV